MPRKFLLPLLLAGLVLWACAVGGAVGEPAGTPGGIAWSDSLQAAKDAAKAQARPIFIYFHQDG